MMRIISLIVFISIMLSAPLVAQTAEYAFDTNQVGEIGQERIF